VETFSKGQTFLLPAGLGTFTIQTTRQTEIIVSYP
jgi:hypothetical protein